MKSLFRPFPTPLTGRQWFYLLVLQGVFAGIIDGGANFGIAYAMYHNQKKIKMWVLAENTIAGDLGVTPIIQCLASMLITSTLVHTDLHHHAVLPLPFVWPHVEHLPDPREIIESFFSRRKGGKGKDPKVEGKDGISGSGDGTGASTPIGTEKAARHPSESRGNDEDGDGAVSPKGLGYYIRMLIRFIFEGTEYNILFPLSRSTPLRIFLTAAQGAGIGIVFGLPLWLLFIVVIGPIYRHENMAETGWKWAPMVIKCVYGAVLGWITNPVIASLALGSQAEHHLLVISAQKDEEEDVEAGTTDGQIQAQGDAQAHGQDAGGVETIREDEELSSSIPPQSPQPLPLSPRIPFSERPGSLRAPSLLLTPNRPRARSRASSSTSNYSGSRPPLTANCSNMPLVTGAPPSLPTYNGIARPSDLGLTLGPQPGGRKSSFSGVPRTPRSAPLPSGQFNSLELPLPAAPFAASGPSAGQVPTTPSGRSLRPPKRERGATISSYFYNTDVGTASPGTPSGQGSWSYALGGTGGRAQRRPRAMSSLSGRAQGNDRGHDPGLGLAIGQGSGTVNTAQSGTPISTTASALPPAWDVFGQVTESASTPMTTPTRPGRRSTSMGNLKSVADRDRA